MDRRLEALRERPFRLLAVREIRELPAHPTIEIATRARADAGA